MTKRPYQIQVIDSEANQLVVSILDDEKYSTIILSQEDHPVNFANCRTNGFNESESLSFSLPEILVATIAVDHQNRAVLIEYLRFK